MKVFIKTFGCRVNQVESQAVFERFQADGHIIINDFNTADLCLLNTCCVTHKADRDVLREIRKIIKANPSARLIITGCAAAAQKEKITAQFSTVEIIYKTDLGRKLFGAEIDWTIREHNNHSRAFVKIQDGCDYFCSYCIVPYARPQKSSKPKQILLEEIKNLIAAGYHEIVLSGINIGNYKCPKTGADLAEILPEIFALKGDFRIRFSSIELNTITDKLVENAARGGEKFCNYFHIPLQSGSDFVLKDMKRKYGAREYAQRVEYIRNKIPNTAVFCDIIAGYPSETPQDFEASLKFLNEIKFAGLHVFSFSPREGTLAAALKQLPPAEIKKRADILRAQDKRLRAAFAQSLIGTTQQFLAEEETALAASGVSSNFQRIIIKDAGKTNGFEKVKIISAEDGICRGVKI